MSVVGLSGKNTFDISGRMRQAQIILANRFKGYRLNEILF